MVSFQFSESIFTPFHFVFIDYLTSIKSISEKLNKYTNENSLYDRA